MHSLHGDIHEIGLQDDCPGCEELAERWTNLDATMLENLVARNYEYRFGKNHNEWNPRSFAESAAMVNITNVMEKMGKLFETDPITMVNYLTERWHIDFGTVL